MFTPTADILISKGDTVFGAVKGTEENWRSVFSDSSDKPIVATVGNTEIIFSKERTLMQRLRDLFRRSNGQEIGTPFNPKKLESARLGKPPTPTRMQRFPTNEHMSVKPRSTGTPAFLQSLKAALTKKHKSPRRFDI